MRAFANVIFALAVIGLGYWAYHQSIQTKAAIDQVETLQRHIGRDRERLAVLRAEWAYLNRPDRLRELADLNFEALGLMPMTPDQFGEIDEIIRPAATPLVSQDAGGAVIENASGPERP